MIGIGGVQNLATTFLGKFTNSPEIAVAGPLRHIGIAIFVAGKFNDCRQGIDVPVKFPAVCAKAHKVGNRGEGCFANIALMVELVPKCVPDRSRILIRFETPQKRSRVES